MTTDSRTTNPSTEQIEAEARERFPELDPKYASMTYPAEAMRSHNRSAFESGARWAALVAAQGAALQTESEEPWLDAAGNEAQRCLRCGKYVFECCESFAQVLPSSGVDEDALAEVIARSRGFGNGWEQIPPLTRSAYREIARAVAEWLKGQGGESRGR